MNLFGGNILKIYFRVVIPTPNITIFTDASETGWGITDEHNPSEGQWAEHERMHINVLYLKKTLWPLFMDGVQLPQGYSHFKGAVYFLPPSSKKIMVLILSTSEG